MTVLGWLLGSEDAALRLVRRSGLEPILARLLAWLSRRL